MAFEKTPRGSYGQQIPGFAKPLMKLMNPLMVMQARRGPVKDSGTLVLTTTGAKSGQRRQAALGYFRDAEDAWLIVASAGGNVANPGWYHNLVANPRAEIELGGRKVPVTATQLTGPEREAAWQKVITISPRYANYSTKTDRLIPIIRLAAV
jgi:deazaflavin-dependent oxidoreductase (nitroreductase family)